MECFEASILENREGKGRTSVTGEPQKVLKFRHVAPFIGKAGSYEAF